MKKKKTVVKIDGSRISVAAMIFLLSSAQEDYIKKMKPPNHGK